MALVAFQYFNTIITSSPAEAISCQQISQKYIQWHGFKPPAQYKHLSSQVVFSTGSEASSRLATLRKYDNRTRGIHKMPQSSSIELILHSISRGCTRKPNILAMNVYYSGLLNEIHLHGNRGWLTISVLLCLRAALDSWRQHFPGEKNEELDKIFQ